MTDYAIAGPSTISPEIFREALVHRDSPVQNISGEAYAICVEWQINPACALGFFVNESNAGTAGAAVQTKNWGNLRAGPGAMRDEGGFAGYASFLVSLNYWSRLLRGPLYEGSGLTTVSAVTPRYAPSGDANDPTHYAEVVNGLVAEWETLSQGSAG